jgi:hypothetical protein
MVPDTGRSTRDSGWLAVRAALSGELEVDSDLMLGERLRHDREPAS